MPRVPVIIRSQISKVVIQLLFTASNDSQCRPSVLSSCAIRMDWFVNRRHAGVLKIKLEGNSL